MDTIADYNAWKAKQQESNVAAANVVLSTTEGKPDEVAGDLNLANEFGKVTGGAVPPTPLVKEYRNVFQQRIEEERNKTILSTAPRLTEWLRNPDNAAIARDDLKGLSWWETTLGATSNAVGRGVSRAPQIYNQYMSDSTAARARDREMSFGELFNDARRTGMTSTADGSEILSWDGSEIFEAGARWIDARFADLIGTDDKAASVEFQQRAGQIAKKIAATPMSPAATRFKETMFNDLNRAKPDRIAAYDKAMFEWDGRGTPPAKPEEPTAGEQAWADVAKFAKDFAADPAGAMAFLSETAIESVPSIAVATGATLATKNPAIGAAVMGGTSYAQERYTSPVEFFQEKGIDVSTPEGAAKVLSDPALMKEAAERGFLRGAIIGALDGVSGGIAGKALARSPIGNMALQGLTQAVMGGGGEAMAQLATDGKIDMREVIVEAMAEFATAPVEVAGMSFERFRQSRRKAKDAERAKTVFEDVSAQAQASPTRARTPDKFRDIVAQATEDGPAENVYVPADQFAQYFQSIGIDPGVIVDELEGVTRDDLAVALAGGGDLQIPTATYAAKLAGTEHDAFLLENMRFDPDQFTAKEAAEFNAKSQEAMQEAWELAEAARVEQELNGSYEQEIYDTMVSRLRVAGRATDVATNEAMLYPAFYKAMAERTGATIDDLLRRYPLPEVKGSLPEGMQFRNVDELNRTLAEARAKRTVEPKRGPTLLEWISDYGGINDVGGELKARDAETIRRGKGKKTLRLSRRGFVAGMTDMLGGTGGKKFGVDDVALAAIEAGYLHDNPVANEYRAAMNEGRQVPDIGRALYEAIDNELRGTPQYAGDVSAQADDSAALDSIEEYLSSLGVSLENTDEEIRTAIESARQYAQAAYHGTPHLFEKFSTDHIGAGEGNQAFGWGLYFAGRREVAEWYRDVLSEPVTRLYEGGRLLSGAEENAAGLLLQEGSREDAIELIERTRSFSFADHDWIDKTIAAMKSLDMDNLRQERDEKLGRLFEVDVPEDKELMAWDDLLSEQPNDIRSKIKEVVASLPDGNWRVEQMKEDIRSGADMKAENIYRSVSMALGSDKAASQSFLDAGIPGHRFLDGGSRRDGDGSYNYVIYDDSRVSVRSYEQRNEIGPRGSIQFLADGQSIMRLMETANLSTVLHESGHFFLTTLQDMAAKGEQSAITDFEAVKGWWRENASAVAADARRSMPDVKVTADDVIRALETGSTGDAMLDGAIDVGMQEQWARGFEAYLMEGKAPSAELRGAFEKFRAWLVSIYQRLAGLNVTISDDVRAVMDRLLATDAEIAKAKSETGDTGPMFATAEQMGLTPEEYAAFTKLRTQAEDEAKSRLLRETMAPIKREQEKAYKAEKAKVREEVENEVNAFRYFRAIEWMGNRRWLGEGRPLDMPDMRLSKQVLVDRYGPGVLETLPRGKQTVYTVEGGVDPDEAAGWFGFESGDEMIRAMERAPKRSEAIAAETERVMRDRHGDALNDGSIEAAALDAVHTDKRGQWIAAELKAVHEIAEVGKPMTAKEARATARDTISRMRVRDAMNANRFLSAERKAAEESARLGAMLAREGIWMGNARRRIATKARAAVRGDGSPEAVAPQVEQANRSTGNYNETVARLIDAKRRQLLNHAFYMEARKVTEEVEKAERYVGKLGKASTRERIAGAGRRDNAQVDYLSAIDELLDQYDFRRLSGKAEARRGALNAFLERMRAAGRENELAIPEKVLADASRKPYKTLPVEELRGVIDTLKNLEHIALRWDKLIDAQRERDFSATAEAIAEAIDKNLPKRPPGPVKSKGEQARNTFRAYLDSVLNATTLLREMDGFTDQGSVYQGIKAPIDEAQNRLIVRKREAAEKFEELYSVYTKEERRNMAVREHMPALGMSLSKWERIAIALNTGNEGNLSRLTDTRQRRPLTLDQVRAVLATLDERDANFIQSVWDYIGSFKADIADRERRATGVEPQWVEPTPVMIGGKELRGGYYPIKYDTRLSSTAADRETVDIAQSLAAGRFGKAQTRNGHLKERAAAGDGSLDLDMAVMHRHVNQVIYDLEMSEPVANAWRLIQDVRVRSALEDAGRASDFDALQAWLKDAAEGELGATSPVGAVLRGLKSNFTAAKLAFNVKNALLQVAGTAQSFVVVGKRDMAIGIMKTARDPFGMAEAVAGMSPFMASRQTTFNKDIMDFYSDPREGMNASRWKDFKRNMWGPLSFWLMQKVQWHFADVPTWVGGYNQGLRKFNGDETKAIAHADALVKRAQASGLFIDRAGIERGSLSSRNRQNDVVKLFTTLGSYMFAKFNVAYERSATASRTIRQEGVSFRSAAEVASWTLDMVLLFTLEAIVAAAINGKLPGGDDDDEKDDGWAKWLAKNTAFSVLGTLPFIRDGVSALQGHGGGGAYGSVIEDTAKGFISAGKIAGATVDEAGEVKASDIKNIVNATGVATGMPTVFINRIVDAGWRQSEGKDVSPAEYIFGRMGKGK